MVTKGASSTSAAGVRGANNASPKWSLGPTRSLSKLRRRSSALGRYPSVGNLRALVGGGGGAGGASSDDGGSSEDDGAHLRSSRSLEFDRLGDHLAGLSLVPGERVGRACDAWREDTVTPPGRAPPWAIFKEWMEEHPHAPSHERSAFLNTLLPRRPPPATRGTGLVSRSWPASARAHGARR
jgi:hypothetical protein